MANPTMLQSLATMPMPEPQKAPAADSLNWLQSLPVFGDRPVEDRNRALLLAGAAALQSGQTGGDALARSIKAGLGSLDATDKVRSDASQQQVDNAVTAQQVVTEQQKAKTAQADQAQRELEWTEGSNLRTAEETLKLAQAGYYDRLPETATGGSASITDQLKLQEFEAAKRALWILDQRKPIPERAFSSFADPRLENATFGALALREGVSGSESVGIIAESARAGAEMGKTIEGAANPAFQGATAMSEADKALYQGIQSWDAAQWKKVIAANDPAINEFLKRNQAVFEEIKLKLQGQ